MPENLENSVMATGLEKVSFLFFFFFFEKVSFHSNAKECSNYHTTAFISDTRKVMLKILQAGLQQYLN